MKTLFTYAAALLALQGQLLWQNPPSNLKVPESTITLSPNNNFDPENDSTINRTIQKVKSVNALGIADSLGIYCRLQGTVNSQNLTANGLHFTIIENGYGIQVYNGTDTVHYQPQLGDSLAVIGFIRQIHGQLRMEVDSIRLLATEQSLTAPNLVTSLKESDESTLVTIDNLRLSNPNTWTNEGTLGFRAEAIVNNQRFTLFIPTQSPLYKLPAPQGQFRLTALVEQHDLNDTLSAGYELIPLSTEAIGLYIEPFIVPMPFGVCETDSFTLAVRNIKNAGTTPIISWYNHEGKLLQTSTDTTFRALASSDFRVAVKAQGDLIYNYANADSTGTMTRFMTVYPKPRLGVSGERHIKVGDTLDINASYLPEGEYFWIVPIGTVYYARGVLIYDVQPSDAGIYRLWGFSREGCASDTVYTEVTVDIASGIQNSLRNSVNLTIYPNPTIDGNITLLVNNLEDTKKGMLTIHNLAGKQLFQKDVSWINNSLQLPLAVPLPKGIYTIKLQTDTQIGIQRLVVP